MSIKPDTNSAADLARFIAEKTTHNLFLTGKAGTGKTVFLRDFVAHSKKKVVVLAPTGIAAINANAMTIHSFCRFGLAPCPLGRFSEGNDFLLDDAEEELVRNIDMIIIDEVSMVRADVMDHISEKIRLIRESDEPFGGVQLLLIGDLYQLPPVVTKEDEEILRGWYGSNYFFFNSEAIKKVGFETVCLNKVYRQNNPEFVNILNNAREGNVSSKECNKLNTRFIPEFEMPEDKRYITLVAQRKQADGINEESLMQVEGDSINYKAEITGDFPAELYPTNRNLRLKKGAQVMFVKNGKEDAYCNGTLGEVVYLEEDKISVRVVEKTIEVTKESWDNIRYEYNKEKKRIETMTVGTFTQYPLKPAWAITIHKSQGLSFDNAIIDIPRAFAAGQAYVALSRCRTLEGLVLKKKLYPDAFFTDSLVTDFYERVDSEVHLARLSKAVGFKSFEWEDDKSQKTDSKQITCISKESKKSIISETVDEIISHAEYWVYHLGMEFGGSLEGILKELKDICTKKMSGFAKNPYYAMKFNKEVYKEVRRIVVQNYHEGNETLDY